jgi:uncharacterized protein
MNTEVIAQALGVKPWQVKAVLKLLQEGATLPFIARYRKEATGNLDELQVGEIKDQVEKAEALEKRREYVLSQIEELGKMTPELRKLILEAVDMQTLEDLYLPYKARRKTRADVAREKGLEPLARILYDQRDPRAMHKVRDFVGDKVPTEEEALQGARDIIAEWINEDAVLRSKMRQLFEQDAHLFCKHARGKKDVEEAQKFRDYFDHHEPLKRAAGHRFLAMMRGVELGFLKMTVEPDEDRATYILKKHCLKGYSDATDQVRLAMSDAYSRLLQPSLENEMIAATKEKADEEAIGVFAVNAKQLLLAPPLGEKRVLALDPGFRTGCKAVVLSEYGDLLHHEAIFPHEPQFQTKKSTDLLQKWVSEYRLEAIAIGNGTAGRETDAFVRKALSAEIAQGLQVYMVNESGASIYSASAVAREEFPKEDVTVRGAVSIGRRLKDPLAELVKIDPKSIGVGQYQHDVNQTLLQKRLDAVVESAVNGVGVNLNTASKHLLSYVSGLGPVLATNIVSYREKLGGFSKRSQLMDVPRLGGKAFEQCAGFLRIRGGDMALDNTGVHPERYAVVQKMAKDLGVKVQDLLGNESLLRGVSLSQYVNESEGLGLPTLEDIVKELQKPGLDPRGVAEAVTFDDTVRSINDLQVGMELWGVVTNLTNFGAFVDIGVKQDGLVHISQLGYKYVKNPAEVVALAQRVKVRVLEVDRARKRIQLTMKF